MNTPVNFEISKLLKEKGWNKETLCHYFEDGVFRQNELRDTVGMDYGSDYIVEFSELIHNFNDNFLMKKNGDRCFGCNKNQGYFETFSAPTIAEVIMWLYEKHGIWISIEPPFPKRIVLWEYYIQKSEDRTLLGQNSGYDSPTKAYEAGIEYALKNLIP